MLPFAALSQSDFDKAEKFYREGSYNQSQLLFEAVLKQNPNHLKAIEYLGDIEGHNQDWDKAIEHYQKLKKRILVSRSFFLYKYHFNKV